METEYRSVVFMGKSGSGKGTQARRLASELGYEVFSTGDKVREIASQGTELAKRIQKIQVSSWAPEWLASYLMTKAILEARSDAGLVFESVARKPLEAQKFDEIHEMLERPYIVLHLDASDEVVTKRMQQRRRDESDSEENIKNRLRAYKEETMQSLEYFKERSRVVTVNANGSEEEVFEKVKEALKK